MKIPESTETLIKYLQCLDILSSEISKYNFRKNVYTFIAAQRKQLYDELTRRRENEKKWEKKSIFYGDITELMEKEKITYKEACERIANEKNLHND